MADNALVDAHVIVDPKISVSEGHYIAEAARQAVLTQHHVMDVMVHIDPEDDLQAKPNDHLPSREVLLNHLAGRLGETLPLGNRTMLHYLDGKIDADLFLDAPDYHDPARIESLQRKCDEITSDDPYFRSLHLHRSHAQK